MDVPGLRLRDSVKKALVVDDNQALCEFIAIALERIGFQVQTAENGYEGFNVFLKGRWDLVITDFQMPVMNGFALINKIKAQSPETPVILISGDFLDLSEIGGHQVLAGVLHKPFSLSDLHRMALQAVAQKRYGMSG